MWTQSNWQGNWIRWRWVSPRILMTEHGTEHVNRSRYCHPPTKLWEDNVFSRVCPSVSNSVGGGGVLMGYYPWCIGPHCVGPPRHGTSLWSDPSPKLLWTRHPIGMFSCLILRREKEWVLVTNLKFLTRGSYLGSPGFLANFCQKQERKKKQENEKLIVKKYITFDVQHSFSVPWENPVLSNKSVGL